MVDVPSWAAHGILAGTVPVGFLWRAVHPVATGLPLLLSKLRLLQGASFSGSARGLSLVKDGVAVYRPRHPERSTFYQILDQHFDRYVAVHEERFEPKAGPLRSIVRPVVEAFLDCGQLNNRFARLRCGACAAERLIAFSCGSRNSCPSCQAKRSALFAEKLTEKILPPVGHRHLVFTLPKALRGLFERDRRLLALLSRCAYETVRTCFQEVLGRTDAVPGFVASLQTFGSFFQLSPAPSRAGDRWPSCSRRGVRAAPLSRHIRPHRKVPKARP